jgi:hypothetical protein
LGCSWRRFNRRRRIPTRLDWTNEAVTSSGYGLNISGSFRRVREDLPEPRDCGIQTAIEIDMGSIRPKPSDQFFTGYDFARTFEQCGKHLKRLVLETQTDSAFAQFRRFEINFKFPETHNAACRVASLQRFTSIVRVYHRSGYSARIPGEPRYGFAIPTVFNEISRCTHLTRG